MLLGHQELTAGLDVEFSTGESFPGRSVALVVIPLGVSAGLTRSRPAVALVAAWIALLVQFLTWVPVFSTQVIVTWVLFGCALWGRRLTVGAAGVSIPAGAALIGLVAVRNGVDHLVVAVLSDDLSRVLETVTVDQRLFRSANLVIVLAIMSAGMLLLPWLAGLSLRLAAGARDSRRRQLTAEQDAAEAVRQTAQARQIARLQEEQARLTRDVHDVVGHSLTVILAQAQSAQYLPDDPGELRRVMDTIAASSRAALQDVRRVLGSTAEVPIPDHADLDRLVRGVRDSGVTVESRETGEPRPLPPELGQVAHRVLQEMLTNALRHGMRDRPVVVVRHWGDDLRLEVRNAARRNGPAPTPGGVGPATTGQGLGGMRRRVEAVGGRLVVLWDGGEDDDAGTFVVTAWIPTRDLGGTPPPGHDGPAEDRPAEDQPAGDEERTR